MWNNRPELHPIQHISWLQLSCVLDFCNIFLLLLLHFVGKGVLFLSSCFILQAFHPVTSSHHGMQGRKIFPSSCCSGETPGVCGCYKYRPLLVALPGCLSSPASSAWTLPRQLLFDVRSKAAFFPGLPLGCLTVCSYHTLMSSHLLILTDTSARPVLCFCFEPWMEPRA